MPMVREFFTAHRIDVAFTEFDSGEALLAAFSPGAFDLILLDVYMGGITGVETATRLKAAQKDCQIIFTTISAEHGADAFDVEAFHYLVKPIQQDKLFSILGKWYAMVCEVKMISLKCGRAIRDVFITDILYIDVQGRCSTVHTETERIETSMSLSCLEYMLPAGEFVKPIRYCLAALRHIKTVGENSIILQNGEQLAITRRERDNVKNQLAAWRLRRLRGR